MEIKTTLKRFRRWMETDLLVPFLGSKGVKRTPEDVTVHVICLERQLKKGKKYSVKLIIPLNLSLRE